MNKLKQKNLIYLLLVFFITCLIGYNLFVYNSVELKSGNVPLGAEKEISEEVTTTPMMLSYGPNQTTVEGAYLIYIKYSADMPGNYYQLYTDDNGGIVYREELLDENKNVVMRMVNTENVNMQVLTYFNGSGSLHIKQVGMIPISVIVLAGTGFVLILAYIALLLWGNNPDIVKVIRYPAQWVTGISFCVNAYFIDGSSYAGAKQFAAVLVLNGLVVLIINLFDSVDSDAVYIALSALTVGSIEMRNIVLYGFDFMVLCWTMAITVLILLAYYCLFRGVKIFGIVITTVFALYSFAQYMYSQYFNDFFTLKIIKLFTTAMEASSSIAELITIQSLSYLFILLAYYIVIWSVSLFYERFVNL